MQDGHMRKIILFIVEGRSDVSYLGPLKSIIRQKGDKRLDFKITKGDILTHNDTTFENVEEKIYEVVKGYLEENKLLEEDIYHVIHIADLDGVYIADSKIIQQNDLGNERIIYYRDRITTINKRNIILRNRKKRLILNKLHLQNEIKNNKKAFKYRLYYFSTNIDDYFFDKQNCADETKETNSDFIYYRYINEPEEYRDYIENNNATKGNYNETWEHVKQEYNSLSRCTNFDKFFEEIVDKIS